MRRIDESPDPVSNAQPLPNATLILTLGIISLISLFCYMPVSFLLAIVTLILSYTESKNYNSNPNLYTSHSYTNLKTGRICALVAMALAVVMALAAIIGVSYFFSKMPFWGHFMREVSYSF